METNSPGYIEAVASTKRKSKEDLQVDQLIPSGILENLSGDADIKVLLQKYYDFMNINEFIYQTDDEEYSDIILDGKATFRIPDPDNKNNTFFTDESGGNSTFIITDVEGNTSEIPLTPINVSITNGNELPGSLKNSTSEIGKTFTVTNLNPTVATVGNAILPTNDFASQLLAVVSSNPTTPTEFATWANTSASDGFLYGDLNKNGSITTLDAFEAGRLSAGTSTESIKDRWHTIIAPSLESQPWFAANTQLYTNIVFGSTITLAESNSAISIGQPVTGDGVPQNTVVEEINGTTLKISNEVNLSVGAPLTFSNNTRTAKLTTITKYWVGPGPSNVMNNIESAMDIDSRDSTYLNLIQKEIAAAVPRGIPQVDKTDLYKRIIDFYKVRGSSDSIETFFRLLFNESVDVERPYDNTLIPSSGNWDTEGNQFLSSKGFISEKENKLHDNYRYQKYSYLLKTGRNISDWEHVFNRLVHPAGFIFFGQILIYTLMTRAERGGISRSGASRGATFIARNPENPLESITQNIDVYDRINRLILSSMPGIQPGVIGKEDLPLLLEAYAAVHGPSAEAHIYKSAILQPVISDDGLGRITAVQIIEKGKGYIGIPTITVDTINGHAAPAADFEFTPIMNDEGGIDKIQVDNEGEGYDLNHITITVTQSGHDAKLGQLYDIHYPGLANKKFRRPPKIRISEPTSVDAEGNKLPTNVQATAEFNLHSTGVDYIETINGGSGYTVPNTPYSDLSNYPLTVVFSQPEIELPTADHITHFGDDISTAYIHPQAGIAGRRNINFGRIHTEGWVLGDLGYHNLVHDTSEFDTGTGSMRITTSLKSDNPYGGTNTFMRGTGVYLLLLDQSEPNRSRNTADNILGKTVRVTVKAKAASTGGATDFDVAFSTRQDLRYETPPDPRKTTSGWRNFILTDQWQDYSFDWEVPGDFPGVDHTTFDSSVITDIYDHISFQGDGNSGTFYVDNVSITIPYDYPIGVASSNPDTGAIEGVRIEHSGSGYTRPPTARIPLTQPIEPLQTVGPEAVLKTSLIPAEVDENNINITNGGNGYANDPIILIESTQYQEYRAKDIHMHLDILVNHLSDGSKAIPNNNYFNRKGNTFANSSKKFNMNIPINQLGSEQISSQIDSINKYNTNSFINIET